MPATEKICTDFGPAPQQHPLTLVWEVDYYSCELPCREVPKFLF